MELKKHLSEPWFTLVKLGLKTVEGRLNKGDFSKLNLGDIITFYNEDFEYRQIRVKVVRMKKYKTFKTYLQRETLTNCLPGFYRIDEGLKVYFKYFTKEQEKQYEIKAIEMDLLK